jgi:RNA recognition motif-containing protein
MFAHMSSIQEAMDALSALKQREPYMNLRLNFAKERCDRSINPVTQAKSPNNPFEGTMSSSMAVSLAGQPPVPRDQRCLYIGGLTEDMTAEDLSQAIRAGGPVFYIKMMPAKMCAFVSFVEASSAYILFAYSNAPSGGLFVKGRRVRVSWAKNYILPHDAIDAIRQGATRNLYLGNIDLETMTRESITADFAAFGEVEQVVVLPEKNTAFINFCALMDAVNALTAFRTGTGIGEKYAQCRLNYGRDRCALEPRNLPGILADYRQHCDKMSAMGMQAPPLSFQGRPPMPPGPMSGPPPRPMDGTGSQPPVAYNNYGNAPPPMQQGFNNYAGQPPANYNNYGSNQQIVGEVKGQ